MQFLPGSVLNLAEYKRQVWFMEAPVGVTVDDLMRPPFWAHYAGKLARNSMVEVVASDGSFDVELRVVDSQPGFVKMRMLRAWENAAERQFADTVVAAAEHMEPIDKNATPRIEFAGKAKWRLIGFDGNEVKRGLATRAEAELALQQYEQRAAA